MGQESLRSTGQFMDNSTGMPGVRALSVENQIPALEMFWVRPKPVSAMRWP